MCRSTNKTYNPLYQVLHKDSIELDIVAHLPLPKRGFKSKAPLYEIVNTALRGGEQVVYQGRKKRKTTNSLYFTDRQGLPLVMSKPIAGNHNDVFNIAIYFEDITYQLTNTEIPLPGLFINTDAGFDYQKLRGILNDKEIIANICPNKRNGQDNEDNYTNKDMLLKEPMLGYIAFVLYSIDLIPQFLDGWHGSS